MTVALFSTAMLRWNQVEGNSFSVVRWLMLERNPFPSTAPLGPDDLELLRKFLEAWCDENSVDVANPAAADVASALIDWYQSELGDRTLLKSGPSRVVPDSPKLQQLLRQLNDA
jgi:hypothetical protein